MVLLDIFIVFILFCLLIKFLEFFKNINNENSLQKEEHMSNTGDIVIDDNTNVDNKNNKHVVDYKEKIDLLSDILFEDVVFYTNDEEPYDGLGKLGVEKCLKSCNGLCTEFGVTGSAFCFPSNE